ncbi:ABC transporter permease [Microvirga lotononidis]|uniref:Putative ABC-type transport system involved in lysophospholipase L1 biosynthesis, permease component n=1 Tax=Microvirga lotononidis TaxID=864069 RepID=I4YMU7_9HYPH|nr:ABC transporter permease [Microvirga lotononidis]EIM25289.1 putative ABC-type transport system involved in lysophospholipase L1 biosynthesis, permease component [Microvirga lotononidis]WQO29234.1 ABC transporter permease [Microvirga lotononidis]
MHGSLPATPQRHPASPSRLPLLLRLAFRELRGGLKGFGIFLACIALGVAAIASVSTLSRSLTEGISREGRRILGGDMAFSLLQRDATAPERTFLESKGRVNVIATLRAMAVAGEKGSGLVEMKAVDGGYPTVGALETDPPLSPADLFAEKNGAFGAAVDPALLARLDLKVGDRVTVGAANMELRASLVSEPDKIADGIGFGPRLLLSQEALKATGLVQPGSLVRWTYRLTLPPELSTESGLTQIEAEANRVLPEAGWNIRTRLNADPRFARNIERFTQFLTLVGLTALLVGGVGVANAVRGFVDRKRASIATLKSLGAPGGQVVLLYLTQVMLIALVGIALGLAFGTMLPFVVTGLFGHLLPIPIQPTLAWSELGIALLYGVLTALVFALAPLGRAHDVPVSGLFRDQIDPERRWPRKRYVTALVLSVTALVGLSLLAAYDRRIALMFVGAATGSFVLLRLVAMGIMALARRLPRPRRTAPRLALANIHRPGALTPSLVLSLGLGITLLVTLSVIDTNLTRQLTQSLPERAPSFFFLDIPNQQADAFEGFLKQQAPEAHIERVPMMRGRLVTLGGRPVAEVKAPEDISWVLEGDRGITYANKPPEGSNVVQGEWWPEGYRGKPLVSFDRKIAEGLGLKIGDEITVNVLGRNISATIANLREIEWRSMGINFVMVFSPNAFAGAPHTHLATVTFPHGSDAALDARILRSSAQAYPMVTSVRVKDALEAVNDVVSQLVMAIRGASSIALIASLLVLAGALAAGHRARLYDAVVLKTLGATRARLVSAYALEYGLLGLATAVFGILAGTLAAYFIITRVMSLSFTLDLSGAVLASALAVLVSVGLGLMGTWRILSQKPALYLRNL